MVESRVRRWRIVFGIHEWVLTVSVVLCVGMLCIVFNVQCSARTPIAARSKTVLLVMCFGERCICVHPPIALRIRVGRFTSERTAREAGIAVGVKGLLHELPIVSESAVLLLLVVVVLIQMTDVGFDEP